MNYEMINEELQIASVSLADLTLEEVQGILAQWEKDAHIGSLTLFHKKGSGVLVLNKDNDEYQAYLDIAEAYLGGDYELRKKIWNESPSSCRETLEVLEKCRTTRVANKHIDMALKNTISDFEQKMLRIIEERFIPVVAVRVAFRLGKIGGKRAERARRKRGAQHE